MEDMINETAVDTEIIDTYEDGYDSQEDVSGMGLGSMVLPFGAGVAVGAIVVKVVVPVVCDVAEKVTTGIVSFFTKGDEKTEKDDHYVVEEKVVEMKDSDKK